MCDDVSHIRLGPGTETERQLNVLRNEAVNRLVEQVRKEMLKMNIRCKVRVESVKQLGTGDYASEEVQMRAVGGNKVSKGYPSDGSDEDNTYAKFSPSADFRLLVANPNLFGQFRPEQKYYVDLTLAE